MKRNILAAIGLLGLGMVIGILLISHFSPDSVSNLLADEYGTAEAPVEIAPGADAVNRAFNNVSNAVKPTVVSIRVEVETSTQSPFREEFREFFRHFGDPDEEMPEKRRSEANGSGVIISEDGYIVTNNHVVEHAVDDGITIKTYDKKVFKDAELVGTDPLTDLALLKIDAEDLPAVHFADMDKVQLGNLVLAIGNPLGLNSTITMGIISAIGRGGLNALNRSRYAVENYIQTDAAINPGNSGGGLFNMHGSLVGINTAIATRTGTYIGYGFAIPVDLVRAVVEDLIEDGEIDRGYIGISITTVDETDAKAAGLEAVSGVMVQNVLDRSPAEKAGLEPGDIILELDGKKVETSNELQSEIVLRRAGDEVKLTIWRNGKKIYKTVTLQPRDEEGFADVQPQKGGNTDKPSGLEPVKFEKLGFKVEPVDKEVKEALRVENGAFISSVKRFSPAAERGLMPNGVIVKADRKDVKSPKELKEIIENKDKGEAILLQVKYKDSFRVVAIEIPS